MPVGQLWFEGALNLDCSRLAWCNHVITIKLACQALALALAEAGTDPPKDGFAVANLHS
jgi:hypothetical protein